MYFLKNNFIEFLYPRIDNCLLPKISFIPNKGLFETLFFKASKGSRHLNLVFIASLFFSPFNDSPHSLAIFLLLSSSCPCDANTSCPSFPARIPGNHRQRIAQGVISGCPGISPKCPSSVLHSDFIPFPTASGVRSSW